MLSIGQIAPKGLKKEKNDDCVTAGKLLDDIPSRIYLFRLGLHFVPGLQSAVCSLRFVLTEVQTLFAILKNTVRGNTGHNT